MLTDHIDTYQIKIISDRGNIHSYFSRFDLNIHHFQILQSKNLESHLNSLRKKNCDTRRTLHSEILRRLYARKWIKLHLSYFCNPFFVFVFISPAFIFFPILGKSFVFNNIICISVSQLTKVLGLGEISMVISFWWIKLAKIFPWMESCHWRAAVLRINY